MKFNNKLIALSLGAMSLSLISCENQDNEFSDYEGGVSVYFPYQTPVRTIVLGSDEYDTSLDKEHKCKISATMGGSYTGRNIIVDFVVDTTLCQNVQTSDSCAIKAMPSDYYELSSDAIYFNGKQTGSVEVQLTDKFFADPEAVKNTYVIPLVMRNQIGADRILTGEYDSEIYTTKPSRLNADCWTTAPMDYVLYCVKYQNKYTSYYSRCGKYGINSSIRTIQVPDQTTAKWKDVNSDTTYYYFDPVTDGADCHTVTRSLNQVSYPLSVKVDTINVNCDLLLTFDENDNCTITSETEGYVATGTGKFTANGAEKAWGDKDRDLIELEYILKFEVKGTPVYIDGKESLVWKRSGVSSEELSLQYLGE